MGEAKHTPGPWEAVEGTTTGRQVIAPDQPKVRRNVAACGGPNRDANARLIAAAPDHALVAAAMCVGAGRWEPWGDGRGEFCMNGLRHVTELDEFGVPKVTPAMRAALAKALGQ